MSTHKYILTCRDASRQPRGRRAWTGRLPMAAARGVGSCYPTGRPTTTLPAVVSAARGASTSRRGARGLTEYLPGEQRRPRFAQTPSMPPGHRAPRQSGHLIVGAVPQQPTSATACLAMCLLRHGRQSFRAASCAPEAFVTAHPCMHEHMYECASLGAWPRTAAQNVGNGVVANDGRVLCRRTGA